MPAYVVSFYKLCALISDQSLNPNQIHNHNYVHNFTQSQILAGLIKKLSFCFSIRHWPFDNLVKLFAYNFIGLHLTTNSFEFIQNERLICVDFTSKYPNTQI